MSPHSSDAREDDGQDQDNTITLNNVALIATSVRSGMVSEFATGLKVGKATYDEREHSSWQIFEDFSGGQGFLEAEVREAGGTHWDNKGGVDLRRPRHITLPGRRNTVNPDFDPAQTALFPSGLQSVYVTDLGPDSLGNLYVGIRENMYTLNSEQTLLTRRYEGNHADNQQGASLSIGRVVESVETDGTRFLLATGRVGTGTHQYIRSENGTSWTKSSAIAATPAANASMQLSDAIVWQGLVIAHGESDQIIGSANGKDWDVDSAGALDPRWRTGTTYVNFIGTAMAPWGDDAVYFLSGGRLWVLDWFHYNAVEIRDVSNSNTLVTGTVWNGAVIVTGGGSVWEYNPGNAQTVRRIGMFGKDGAPTSWIEDTGHAGQSNAYTISHFIPGTDDLFAVCRSLVAPMSWRLAVYNGVGWSWYGPEVTSSQPWAATISRFPLGLSLVPWTRSINVAALASQTSADFTLHTFYLPTTGDVPFPGSGQRYEDGPLSFETGWFAGGFLELEGVMLRMSIDGYNLSETETVKVEYRLNNDMNASYTTLGTYTNNQQEIWFTDDHRGKAFKTVQFRITLDRGIGTLFSDSSTQLAEALDDSETGITVDESNVFLIGDVVRIDIEQMLVTNIVAATDTLTVTRGYNSTTAATHNDDTTLYREDGVAPVLKALVLLYEKVPKMRSSWNIEINVTDTVARGMLLSPEEPATMEGIWQFLKSLVNTPRLIDMKVPSLESGGVNVRITDMPATAEEFRAAVGGKGIVGIQLVETAGP